MSGVLFVIQPGRTAGSSLRQVLRRQFPADQIVEIRRGEKFPGAPPPETALVMGEFFFGAHGNLPGEHRYLAMLRNPGPRMRSLFQAMRRDETDPGHAPSLRYSIQEYIEREKDLRMDNWQTRLLAGDAETPYGRCGREMLERAKRNVARHFGPVGMTELFDETLLLWGRELGFKNFFYKRPHPSPEPEKKNGIEDRFTALDQELCNFAREILQERLDSGGVGLRTELKFFRWLNRLYGAVTR